MPGSDALRSDPVYRLKAEMFRVLGHPVRVRMLELLRSGEYYRIKDERTNELLDVARHILASNLEQSRELLGELAASAPALAAKDQTRT